MSGSPLLQRAGSSDFRPAKASGDLVVETRGGSLRGVPTHAGRGAAWLGIPYAAPPVGRLRFAAPEPAAPWAGIRDAHTSGAVAVQPPGMRPGPLKIWLGSRRSRSEDCLFLGVWAPREAAPPRAVVVWFHGGSFMTGAGSQYDGGQLAIEGDVLVVTVNYRLGGLGFLNLHDACDGDERIQTNVGLRDGIAALQWVQANIAAFGGDPGRVTIAGESAGSTVITMIASSAAARGLFHGVIAQSGALTLALTREDAERSASAVRDELGITAGSRDRDRLWRVPGSEILAATLRVQGRRAGSLATRPWWDGDLVGASIHDAYASGPAVPLLIGSNAHEHRTFTRLRRDIVPLTRAALGGVLEGSLGAESAARILRAYPDDPAGLNHLGTDVLFTMPSIHLAEHQSQLAPVFAYRFDYGDGLLRFGAFHGIELLLLYPRGGARSSRMFLGPASPALTDLTQRFRSAWLAFVRDGRPSPDWEPYDTQSRATHIWDLPDRTEHDPRAARRLAWAGQDIASP